MRILCILLVIQAVVSYRSIPRILDLVSTQTPFVRKWTPHFTSVINWSLRLGLGLLKQVSPIHKPWLAIIDHSIDISTKKALVVLRVTTEALSKRGKAIQLNDCECIGLTIAEIVNGESISVELEDIFAQAGRPDAIIKDGDYTLQKGFGYGRNNKQHRCLLSKISVMCWQALSNLSLRKPMIINGLPR